MTHYHICPECSEEESCDLYCSINPDMYKDHQDYGAYYPCKSCALALTNAYKEKTIEPYSKEWFLYYNGFKRKESA